MVVPKPMEGVTGFDSRLRGVFVSNAKRGRKRALGVPHFASLGNMLDHLASLFDDVRVSGGSLSGILGSVVCRSF